MKEEKRFTFKSVAIGLCVLAVPPVLVAGGLALNSYIKVHECAATFVPGFSGIRHDASLNLVFITREELGVHQEEGICKRGVVKEFSPSNGTVRTMTTDVSKISGQGVEESRKDNLLPLAKASRQDQGTMASIQKCML